MRSKPLPLTTIGVTAAPVAIDRGAHRLTYLFSWWRRCMSGLLARQDVLERFGVSRDSAAPEGRQQADLTSSGVQLLQALHEHPLALADEVELEVPEQHRLGRRQTRIHLVRQTDRVAHELAGS